MLAREVIHANHGSAAVERFHGGVMKLGYLTDLLPGEINQSISAHVHLVGSGEWAAGHAAKIITNTSGRHRHHQCDRQRDPHKRTLQRRRHFSHHPPEESDNKRTTETYTLITTQ